MSRYSRPSWAGKSRDLNEQQIVEALEAIGCTVERKGDGVGDLIVGRGAKNILIEVKRPGKANRKDQQEQRKKREAWKGQIAVVETPIQAIEVVTRLTVKTAYP